MDRGAGLFVQSFEVSGKVQGVCFRKHTRKQAERLGMNGWCRNTEKGTVEGEIQGSEQQLDQMGEWLRSVGSPHGRIDDCQLGKRKTLTEPLYDSFVVKK